MEITFLGTSCAEPTAQIGYTSFLVDTGKFLILVDASGNPIQSILAANREPEVLDLVVLTHHHADHIAGYPALIQSLGCMGRKKALAVLCSRATAGRAARLLDVLDVNPMNTVFPIRTCHGFKATDLEIELLEGNHSVPTSMVAIRSGNVRLLYTSDTAYSQRTAELARGYQILIHEATFPQAMAGEPGNEGHSSAYQAGLSAGGAEVDRLFLCHVCWNKYSRPEAIVEEARAAFKGDIVLPEPFVWYSL